MAVTPLSELYALLKIKESLEMSIRDRLINMVVDDLHVPYTQTSYEGTFQDWLIESGTIGHAAASMALNPIAGAIDYESTLRRLIFEMSKCEHGLCERVPGWFVQGISSTIEERYSTPDLDTVWVDVRPGMLHVSLPGFVPLVQFSCAL